MLLLAGTFGSTSAQTRWSGYYKDLFMDCGIALNSYDDLPAAKLLGITMERICTYENGDTSQASSYEHLLMKNVFVGSDIDENGILLYPDGSPRFRAIYVNGGKSTSHGKQVSKKGLDNLRTFFSNGGSYVGTCAGAYFCSKGTRSRKTGVIEENEWYAAIWPGYVTGTGLSKSATGLTVEKKNPLLKWGNYGADMQIDSVRHNGGCYMVCDGAPQGTEILYRYIGDTLKDCSYIHKEVNGWAYKANGRSGRIVVTGSHPERMISGDRLEMFAGMIRYALDGNGGPSLKGVLADTVERRMTCRTHDNNPDYTAIGDRQYHHFAIDIPKGTKQVKIELTPGKGYDAFDLFLLASCDGLAFNTNARWFNLDNGAAKCLTIDAPKSGRLYVSVFCDTTVETVNTKYGEAYSGHVEVLNGVPYIIKATIVK